MAPFPLLVLLVESVANFFALGTANFPTVQSVDLIGDEPVFSLHSFLVHRVRVEPVVYAVKVLRTVVFREPELGHLTHKVQVLVRIVLQINHSCLLLELLFLIDKVLALNGSFIEVELELAICVFVLA